MRLLDTSNAPELCEFIDEKTRPPYAILSHTWDEEEVSFPQLANPSQCATQRGYRKILETCALASKAGIDYAWVDTCCIDKPSSSELMEAINSMYHWYQTAAVCYVILEDLDPDADLEMALPNCRWFTRGWTLQELIAPRAEVLFFDREWNCRGSRSGLSHLLTSITLIPEELLCQTARLSEFSVAQRMSWASSRETTRIEDEAYCLLGIFGVHMALIYGERTVAFRRLQETVLQATGDLSLFAWTDDSENCPEYSGLLASSLRQFKACSDIKTTRDESIAKDLQLTARGIQMGASLTHMRRQPQGYESILNLFSSRQNCPVGIYLRKIGGARYLRWKPGQIADSEPYEANIRSNIAVHIEEEPSRLAVTSKLHRTEFLVEQLSLPTRLPDTFPFHSTDPVLGNRHSVLRMSFSGSHGASMSGRGYVFANFPPSHWDHNDQVFFCTGRTAASWCAMSIKRVVEGGTRRRAIAWNLFVACFHWNLDRPVIFLANMSSLAPAFAHLFQHSLANIKFESATEARALINGSFDAEESIWIRNAGTIAIGPRSHPLLVTVRSRMDQCPDVCVNPVTCLDVSFARETVGSGRMDSKM